MLVAEVERAVRALGLVDAAILVAVSGGIDSTVLLHALQEIARSNGLKLSVAHVNHGLRGLDSDTDEQAVRALAAALGLRVASRRVDPERLRRDVSSRARPTPQEAARTARYAALCEMATSAGCAVVATAHTADDQAETVLLRMLRGSGPDGLAGIPERSDRGGVTAVRPMLRVSRSEVERFAAERGLVWREDRTNASDRYARNRLRHHWLPGLAKDFNPRLLRAIGDLAEAQRRDAEWIETLVTREARARFSLESGFWRIRGDDWDALPSALARRLARWGLRECGVGRDASRVHLERMLRFLRSGRRGSVIELPGGVLLERDADGFRLGPASPTRDPVAVRGPC